MNSRAHRPNLCFASRLAAISILCLLALGGQIFGQAVPPGNHQQVDEETPEKLAELFDETRRTIKETMTQRSWPGLAIAVVDRDRVLWSETFGVRDKNTGEPVAVDTVFNIGSITKTVTATAVMAAVQVDLVDLDAPITDYLPDFTVNSRFEDRPERRITLRHLLNHTAGFTHEAPVGNNFDPTSSSFEAHVASISDTWLKHRVGDRFSYSNLGIDLAGFIIQEVSGVPFEHFVRSQVFEPLGMRSSFVNTPTRNGSCNACATGYNRWFTSLPTYIPMEAAGGMRMNLEDAARYVQFHLNRGNVGEQEIVRAQLLDEMYRPSTQIATWEPMLWYGLGIYSWANFAQTYSHSHEGNGFGFSASVRWYPEYGIGMFLLLNTVERGPDWDLGTALLQTMIEQGLVAKLENSSSPDTGEFVGFAPTRETASSDAESEATPYREEWAGRIGRYCADYGRAYVLVPEVDTSAVCHRIFEQDGYLHHSGGIKKGQRLVEHETGLFFTENSGEALDLRSEQPTFRNITLRKVD